METNGTFEKDERQKTYTQNKSEETKPEQLCKNESDEGELENFALKEGEKNTQKSFDPKITKTDIVEIVKEAIHQHDSVNAVNDAFQKCRTDIERFKVLYTNPIVYDSLHVKEDYEVKNLENAKALRTEGNEHFKLKHYNIALDLYSKSIRAAPLPNTDQNEELSLAYANRSAVLYHFEKYILSLQDIGMALKYNYPAKLKYKILERQGKCYYYLRQKEKAVESFEESLECLDDASMEPNKHETTENEIIKQLMKARKIKSSTLMKTVKDFNHCHSPIPIINSSSQEIPCATDSLVLKFSPERGRGLFTTKDIEAGEVLIVEKPFACVVQGKYDLTHCCHCTNRVFAPIPCEHCSGVVYCSEECRVEAWKQYHFAECRVINLLHKTELGLGHLALRSVLKFGLEKIIKSSEKYQENIKSDILRVGFNEDGVYDSNDYDTIYSLVKHSEKRSLGDLFKRTVWSVFLVKCLETSLFNQPLSSKSHLSQKFIIGNHILRHIQMLPCNAHEISELDYQPHDLPNSCNVEIGTGIYSTLSLINHSCDPNVVRHSYGNLCIVRAIRNISKGSEIFDNYGALYPLSNKRDRHAKLFSQYYFKCSCIACLENWPLYFDIPNEVPNFHCEKCSTPLTVPEDGKTQRAMCEKCRYVQDMTPKLDVFMRSDEIFSKKLKEIVRGEVTSDALDVLTEHLRLLDRLIIRPFADYNDCQEAIKQCLNLQANCKKRDLYN